MRCGSVSWFVIVVGVVVITGCYRLCWGGENWFCIFWGREVFTDLILCVVQR